MDPIPLGKLPPEFLDRLVKKHQSTGERVVLGPGIGLDCAVLDFGDRYLVAKTDPITFTSDRIGWYLVNVNANDVATTGARPAWFLVSALFPSLDTSERDVEEVFEEIEAACSALGAQFIGGHTEVTAGIDRPILTGTMLGEVARDRLVTPRGARPGDALLLTKGIPIEATSILANDFADRLDSLSPDLLREAQGYLSDPGISVVKEALAAADTGGVNAMHDPTEGGLAAGLWELASAAGVALHVDRESIPIPAPARAICDLLGLDPMACIASGALLLSVDSARLAQVTAAIEAQGVEVARIGDVVEGSGVTIEEGGRVRELDWPQQDALTALYQN